MRLQVLGISGLFILLSAAGCSTLDAINPFSASPAEKAADADLQESHGASGASTTASKETSNSENTTTASATGVELLWQVPIEPVDIYHLKVGSTPGDLTRQIDVPVQKLQRLEHPSFGPVFRYVIPDTSAKDVLFISLQAENRFGLSEPSPTFRVTDGLMSPLKSGETSATKTRS